MWYKLAELNAFLDLSGLCGLSHKKEKHSGCKKRLCAVRLLERRLSLSARFAVENEVANLTRVLEFTLVKEACNFVSASFLRSLESSTCKRLNWTCIGFSCSVGSSREIAGHPGAFNESLQACRGDWL